MRLALFCPSYGELAGIGLIAASLSREFSQAGHEVLVLARDTPAAPRDGDASVLRLPYHQMPRRAGHVARQLRFLRQFFSSVRAFRRAVRDFRADGLLALAISTYAPYLFGLADVAPMVVSLQGGEPHGVFAAHPLLFRGTLRRAAWVTACAVSLRRAALGLAPDLASRLTVVPNGVDLERFESGPAFSHPRPYLLAVGRLTRQKGFDVLLDAFAMLDAPGVDLLIAGDGPDREALLVRRERLGLHDRVHLLGAADRASMAALHRGARLVVCPSRWEGLPLVCLEAMAAARPVVASAVDGIPDAVVDGETGALVPADDAPALAAALAALVGDVALCAQLGSRGRERIRERFTWRDVSARYLEIFSRLTRSGPHAAAAADA